MEGPGPGDTFSVAEMDVLPSVAVIVTTMGWTLSTLAAKRIELSPPPTYRVAGGATMFAWLLVKRRVTPPLGVGVANVSTATAGPRRRIVEGLKVKEPNETCAGEKVAEMDVALLIVTLQEFAWNDVQPFQRLSAEPTAGMAVSASEVPEE